MAEPPPIITLNRPRRSARKPFTLPGGKKAVLIGGVVALGVLFLGCAAMAAIITISLGGNDGTVTSETNDDDVEVAVKHNGKEITILDKKTNKTVKLAAGKYQVQIGKGGPDLYLETKEFTLKRGDTEIVKVRHMAGGVKAEARRRPSRPGRKSFSSTARI